MQLLKDLYHIPPIPIGLEWPVTYPIEVKNLGITKLKYQIDLTPLEELNQKNHDFRIFDIQNPEGVLMPNETQYIYTLCKPLEAKNYDLDLQIKVSDIEGIVQNITLKIRAVGYHFESKKPKELPFYEDLPKCRANLNLNEGGSLAAFSTEEVDFGDVQKGIPARRFVILYNLSPFQKLKFDFAKTGLMCADEINLVPISGELEPNSHKNIKMTLTSARIPTFFEGEIQCQIEWEGQDDNHMHGTKSANTGTAVSDSEYLFLRLRKRSKIRDYMVYGVENRDEPLLENVLKDAINDILESEPNEEMPYLKGHDPSNLYASVEETKVPSCQDLTPHIVETFPEKKNQNREAFEDHLKLMSGFNEQELSRKR